MNRVTRSNVDGSLLQVEDPEQLLRDRRRSMAEPGRRDLDNEEGSKPEEVNIPNLFVPDLENIPLEEAIQNGMAMNNRKTIYRIHCPRLKEYIGVDTLTVKLPEGQLEVPTDPPVDFMANCTPTPFDQPRLLVEAMQHLITMHRELTILPGDDLPIVRNRYLTCYELLERLNHYIDRCIKYGECFLRHKEAQLCMDTNETLRKELVQEILMARISSNMDKIVNSLLKDISFRKGNKKATYSTPKVNPRASPVTSINELRNMKAALQYKCRGIMQVAFISEPDEGASSRVITPGEDIPDAMARPREERRRSNLSVNTNNTCPTDRPTVNFNNREHHRTNVISEVQQNLMNISNINDRASNTNVHPDRSDNPNPWSRNTYHNQDNQSSISSDAESIGHWDSNWQNQKCSACGNHNHNAWNCEKKRNGELYCSRCKKGTHCNVTCSVLCNASTPRFQHQYHSHPSPRTDGNYTVPPVEPNFANRPSPAPLNAGSITDVTQMFVTDLNENRQQTNLIKHRKDLLASVCTYDGKDKKACLMWINHVEHTAIQAKMPLKELIAAKAGPIVTTQVQNFLVRVPGASNAQIKQMIMECFSNVGTKTEAFHHLKRMSLDDDESLLAHNAEYAAIHEAAHRITPDNQMSQVSFLNYAKTLPHITSDELTKQIELTQGHQDPHPKAGHGHCRKS